MVKFHISPDGVARRCSAGSGENSRGCKYGYSDEEHYTTKEEATKNAEQKLNKENGGSFGSKNIKQPKKIFLSSNIGNFEVENGSLELSETRAALSSGLCGNLSLSIHDKTGSEIYGLSYFDLDEETLEEQFKQNNNNVFNIITHFVVKSQYNDDCFVDSYGVVDKEELFERFDTQSLIPVRKEMVEYFGKDFDQDLSLFADSAIFCDKNNLSYDFDLDEYEDQDDEDDDEDEYFE